MGRKKILVVDFDQASLASLHETLSHEGYQVVMAIDGKSGWEKFLVEEPDLVLLEPMLSKIHGFELCQRITTHPDLQAPVFIMTGVYKDSAHKTEAIRTYGATEYFEKPLEMPVFLSTIRELLPLPQIVESVSEADEYPCVLPVEAEPPPEPKEPLKIKKQQEIPGEETLKTLVKETKPKRNKKKDTAPPIPSIEELKSLVVPKVIEEKSPMPTNSNQQKGKIEIDNLIKSALSGVTIPSDKKKVQPSPAPKDLQQEKPPSATAGEVSASPAPKEIAAGPSSPATPPKHAAQAKAGAPSASPPQSEAKSMEPAPSPAPEKSEGKPSGRPTPPQPDAKPAQPTPSPAPEKPIEAPTPKDVMPVANAAPRPPAEIKPEAKGSSVSPPQSKGRPSGPPTPPQPDVKPAQPSPSPAPEKPKDVPTPTEAIKKAIDTLPEASDEQSKFKAASPSLGSAAANKHRDESKPPPMKEKAETDAGAPPPTPPHLRKSTPADNKTAFVRKIEVRTPTPAPSPKTETRRKDHSDFAPSKLFDDLSKSQKRRKLVPIIAAGAALVVVIVAIFILLGSQSTSSERETRLNQLRQQMQSETSGSEDGSTNGSDGEAPLTSESDSEVAGENTGPPNGSGTEAEIPVASPPSTMQQSENTDPNGDEVPTTKEAAPPLLDIAPPGDVKIKIDPGREETESQNSPPLTGTETSGAVNNDGGKDPAEKPPPPPVKAEEGDLVPLSEVDVQPQVIKSVDPVYPARAQRFGVEGEITVNALISETGKVIETGILKGMLDDSGLEKAAQDCIRKWKFTPAQKDGVNVKVWKSYIIVFKAK